MDQNNSNYGRDQNIFNQPEYVDVNINFQDLPQLKPLEPNYRLIHYVLTLLSLVWNLVVWMVLGIFAKSEFPIDYVWKLIIACLKGPESFSQLLNEDQREVYQLKENLFRARRNSKEESIRLNNLSSKIGTLENLIQRLYSDIESKEKSVSRILGTLEGRRKIIQLDLEPLKQEYDPNLYKLERLFQVLTEDKSAAEKDYEQIEEALNTLIEKYEIQSRKFSAASGSRLVEDLRQFVIKNPRSIRISRLTTLKSTLELLQWSISIAESLRSVDVFENKPEENVEPPASTEYDTEESNTPRTSKDIEYKYINLEEITEKPEGQFADRAWVAWIQRQVEILLKQTTSEDDSAISRVKLGIEKEWINKISVHGVVGNTDLEKVELSLYIDWDNQQFSLAQAGSNGLENLEKVKIRFLKFVQENNLNPTLRFQYTHPENRDFYNEQLGFSDAEPFRWATQGDTFESPLLVDKVHIELKFGSHNRQLRQDGLYIPSKPHLIRLPAIPIIAIILLSVIFLSSINSGYQPQNSQTVPSYPPPMEQNLSGEPQVSQDEDQENWNQLHKAISVWDLKTAQKVMIPLSQSNKRCIAEFSKTFRKTLTTKGEKGFREVNSIKRNLNKKQNCDIVVIKYEFSP
jgi:hypothetical protein